MSTARSGTYSPTSGKLLFLTIFFNRFDILPYELQAVYPLAERVKADLGTIGETLDSLKKLSDANNERLSVMQAELGKLHSHLNVLNQR